MCFIFLFPRRASVEDLCGFLLCHIQAIIRNAKVHIDCESMPSLVWASLSLSLRLSLEKDVEQNFKHFDRILEYVQ